MMKFASSVATLAVVVLGTALPSVKAQCVTGGFVLEEVEGECNFASLLQTFEYFFDDEVNKGKNCGHDATAELYLLLGATTQEEADVAVQAACRRIFAAYNSVPMKDIPGFGKEFIKNYYLGGTNWNEEYATKYPAKSDGTETNVLREDASMVKRFYNEKGRYGMVEYPDYLPNFDLDTCDMNAAYCCWPQDRQAGDNNGNCATPYDEKCIDKDPADNTDLCMVHHSHGSNSTDSGATEGFFQFKFDDGNNPKYVGEGPIHCHGFAWANDDTHSTAVYKGNNLFYVSMYDHMHQRGYVREIPSAPMCGCAEQMPSASRSDCTQVDVVQRLIFKYDSAEFFGELTYVDIDFNSCQGLNEYLKADNNDLWAYSNRLFVDGMIDAAKVRKLRQKLVGDQPQMCRIGDYAQLSKYNLVRGYDADPAKWAPLVGREGMSVPSHGKLTFDLLYGLSTTKVIRRICHSCYDTHENIYYKRNTPLPADFDLLKWLMEGKSRPGNNVHPTDFQIYSTYEDAVAGTNPWTCNYNYGAGFPGNCFPDGQPKSPNQNSYFRYYQNRYDVAFLIDVASPLELQPSTFVGGSNFGREGGLYKNPSDEKLYLSSYGRNIWNVDEFDGSFEAVTGDFNAVVLVEGIAFPTDWSKSGIMARDDLADPLKTFLAPHFSALLTRRHGVQTIFRKELGGNPGSNKYEPNSRKTSSWIKLKRRGDEFTAFISSDGVTWTMHGRTETIAMSDTVYVGIVTSAATFGMVAQGAFSNLQIEAFNAPTSAPTTTKAPTSLDASLSHDIRLNGNFPGTTTLMPSTDTIVIKASGGSIWNRDDSFRFYSDQTIASTTDFTLEVYLANLEKNNGNSKGGLMIRESLDQKSRHASATLSGDHGIYLLYREAYNGGTKYRNDWNDKGDTSAWLRLGKVGNVYTMYHSFDGQHWYKKSSQTVTMSGDLLVGLATTSNNWNGYATATYKHYRVITA